MTDPDELEARAARLRRVAVPVIAVAAVASMAFAAYVLVSTHNGEPPIAISRSDVVRVRLVPVPEGPGSPTFERKPATPNALSIERIQGLIPVPLPAPLRQPIPCLFGGDLVIELRDGRTFTYGPCKRPDSINHLWAGMVDVITEGGCRPDCGP